MNFTWVAENYSQNSQFQYEHARQALSRFQFKGNETVLDVGCGDGKITADIATKVISGHVLGIDSSASMIKFASSEFHKLKNLQFSVCRAEDIPYEDDFDIIVSFACLHWVKDQLSFLVNAKKALKIGGAIHITLYPKHPDIWGSIDKTIKDASWHEYFINYKNPHISYDLSI